MKIMWLGCASLLIKAGGTCIAVDPFLGMPPTKETWKRQCFARSDHVLVTHGHFDHISQLASLGLGSGTGIWCTPTPAKRLILDGISPERLHRFMPGTEGEVLDMDPTVSITAFPGEHCRFDAGLILQKVCAPGTWIHAPAMLRLLRLNRIYRENGEIVFYEISAGGRRLQIMGSLGLRDDVTYPTGADLLILPYQGRSDLPKQALRLIDRLRPRQVLLDHYDDAFPPMTGPVKTGRIATLCEEALGIKCTPMRVGEVCRVETAV